MAKVFISAQAQGKFIIDPQSRQPVGRARARPRLINFRPPRIRPIPDPPPGGPPDPRKKSPPATPKQLGFASRLLLEHGTTLDDWKAKHGVTLTLDRHITEIRAEYGGRAGTDQAEAERIRARNATLAWLKNQLKTVFCNDGPHAAAEWIDSEDHGERIRTALLVHLNELEAGQGAVVE